MDAGIIAISAGTGALTLAVMGWLSSGEAFNPKKFVGSFLTAIISGIGLAVIHDYSAKLTIVAVMGAFLNGVGADAGRKAIADVTRKH